MPSDDSNDELLGEVRKCRNPSCKKEIPSNRWYCDKTCKSHGSAKIHKSTAYKRTATKMREG